jgi:hypothetical protein
MISFHHPWPCKTFLSFSSKWGSAYLLHEPSLSFHPRSVVSRINYQPRFKIFPLYYRICIVFGKRYWKSKYIFEKIKVTNRLSLLNEYMIFIYIFLNIHGTKMLLVWYTVVIGV